MLQKPPMGWNSWNTFGLDINDKLIRESADALVDTGLRDAGYEYLIIDDGWSRKERDENGRLVADPEKFPDGMKAVADYVHSRGLKFGMYSCAGNLTCGSYQGSFEHEFTDAETFASWGVDYLKYDYCFHSPIIPGKYLYRRMGLALKNCGRDIVFAACTWGADQTHEWIKTTGADTWRSTVDIFDTWQSVLDLSEHQKEVLAYNGHGCFNDMDMLTVGMYGKGNVGLAGCSDTQYQTHYSIWSVFGSPLIIGCDIRNMSEETRRILTNPDIIAIDQDPDYRQPYPLTVHTALNSVAAYARLLANGDLAIGCFNLTDQAAVAGFNLDEMGLPISTGKTLHLRELWTGRELDALHGTILYDHLEPYGSAVFRGKLMDL